MEKLFDDGGLDLVGWMQDTDRAIDQLFGYDARTGEASPETVHIQFDRSQPYRFVRRADGCHVEVEDVESSAQLFWYSRLKNPGLIDYDEAQRAATTAGFVVLFRDGTWDTLPGYQPDSSEHAFWSAVAARFAELPEWVF